MKHSVMIFIFKVIPVLNLKILFFIHISVQCKILTLPFKYVWEDILHGVHVYSIPSPFLHSSLLLCLFYCRAHSAKLLFHVLCLMFTTWNSVSSGTCRS